MEYVSGFLFSKDRAKLVLVLKNRPFYLKGKYNAVGGKIDPGEQPIDAMRREFWEETGQNVTDWYPLGSYQTPRENETIHYFIATDDIDVKTMTDEEIVVIDFKDINSYRFDSFVWGVMFKHFLVNNPGQN